MSPASPAPDAPDDESPASPAPDDEWRFTRAERESGAKVRVAQLAATQFGRVRFDQLRGCGVSEDAICRWRAAGYLHRLLPRVYAVGHPGTSTEADLAAALLYAGPHAMLSHGTAVWWLDLLRYPPDEIHVSTPRRVHSIGSIVVHPRREFERVMHRGLPTTSVSRALLDFATTDQPDLLRLALANAEYQDLLDLGQLQKLTGRGIAGSAAIRGALAVHLPPLAHTRSELEQRLVTLCQTHRLPLPQCNVHIHGWLVDACWPEQRLVVEVDGYRGHRTAAQLDRDHQRDHELRTAGYIVLRYTWRQLTDTPRSVARELRQYLRS